MLLSCGVQSYAPSASLLGAGAVPSAGGSDNPNAPRFSMFNLKSYRKYFNVDTQVRCFKGSHKLYSA